MRSRLRRDDRGAVAVWVALLMVPLLVVAALAIDVGAAHADHQRMQTGADAAALAIAQDCAAGRTCTPASVTATAQQLATANAPVGGAPVASAVRDGQYVEVAVSGERGSWFASAAGVDELGSTAVAAATWSAPTSSTGHLPLTFSWCEILWQLKLLTGKTEQQLVQRDASGTVVGLDVPTGLAAATMYNAGGGDHGCRPGSNAANQVPGGFGWINTGTSCLQTATAQGSWVRSSTGNNPGNCTQNDFLSIKGQLSLLPIYDMTRGSGNNAEYRLVGYVAFRLQAWYFAGQVSQDVASTNQRPCSGNGRCIYGTFERFVALDPGSITGTGTGTGNNGNGNGNGNGTTPVQQFGSSTVALRLPRGRQ